jgi:hypothetical protein
VSLEIFMSDSRNEIYDLSLMALKRALGI